MSWYLQAMENRRKDGVSIIASKHIPFTIERKSLNERKDNIRNILHVMG